MAQLFSGLAMSVDASSNEHKRLIFSHEGNARAAASVILIGVVAALIGSVFMAIGPKVKTTSRAAVEVSVDAASTPVRIVGQAPHNNVVPCDQQVWPNIDQRCLVRTQAASRSEDTSPTARSNEPAPSSAPTTQTPSQVVPSGSTQHASVPPTARQQQSLSLADSSDEATMPLYDDADEWHQQEFTEPPPRKRQHRQYRSFHFHFGAFRF
jgi:hypothetical protein